MPDVSQSTRLAYVGTDGQIHLLELEASGAWTSRQLTWSVEPSALVGWGGSGGGSTASWPCWSPDGRSLACFVEHTDDSDGPATHVAVLEVDGIHEHRLPALTGRMPIHVQWSPDGHRLGVLAQFEDQLELWVAEVRPESGPLRLVAEGSPLFFGWADGGRRIVLHVGDGGTDPARVEVRDVVGDDDDVVFRVSPGNFCVPFAIPSEKGERVLYVIRRDTESQLVSAGLDGEDVLGLAVATGLMALVPAHDGLRVAYTAAPDADGSPYDGVRGVGSDGMVQPEDLVAGPVLAFFWPGALDAPMWVRWDTGRQHIRWLLPRPGEEPVEVGRFRPTRDQYFHLHFFEQFARSHPPVSPDGRWLVWSGHGADSTDAVPRVFLTDLSTPDPRPSPVCAGSYGVFAPARPPG